MRIQRLKRWSRVLGAALVAALLLAWWWRLGDRAPAVTAFSAPPAVTTAPDARAHAAPPRRTAAGKKPPVPTRLTAATHFVESFDRQARFTLRDGGVSAFLDERGIALSLLDGERTWGMRWSMAGARRATPVPAGPALPGVVNDLRGDPASQRTGLRTYDRIAYRELFDGVDMEVEPRERGLEYTLRVAAGARVPELRFVLDGARSLSVEDGGESLRIDTGAGRISEGALLAYQDGRDGVRREVPVRYAYARQAGGALVWEYGLEVGPHDPSLPLVIDPTLAWSTYLGGGGGDFVYGMAVDAAGNRYLTGETISANFPVAGGGFQGALNGSANDAFITKVSGTTEAIVWSTYYGGTRPEQGLDIAVDASSNVYVVGNTQSNDIVMVNGFQTTFGGGTNKSDAFILKIAASGASIIADTYMGGTNDDSAEALFLDSSGNVYVTGSASSANFPTTAGAFQTTCGSCSGSAPPDGFVAKIGAAGSSLTLTWSTFLGGGSDDTGYDISVDASGVWVTGFTASSNFPTSAGAYDLTLGGTQDAFLTKLNPGGTGLVFSTYLGGSGIEVARGLAIDAAGNAYVGGTTQSADLQIVGGFQTTLKGTQDICLFEVNPTGSGLVWSSYFGGSGNEFLYTMERDAAGQLFVGGMTDSSTDFPLIGAVDTTFAGTYEAAIVRVNAGGGSVGFSTYLGGSGQEQVYALGWDAAGNLYAAGSTSSTDFPTAGSAFQTIAGGGQDGWVARITGSGVVPPSSSGPVKLAFTTSAQTINAGACSAAVTVQAQDATSAAANVTAATTVTLSASPTTGFGFYSDPGCTASISSVLIAAGTSTAPSFYFKDNTSGSYTVTASAVGLSSASQVETINPLAATKLALLTGPFTVAAGACSPANTVQRQDTLGNPVTAGTTTVNLSATAPPGFAFYSDAACGTGITFINIGAGSSTALYYFKGTTAGTATVTDSATGLTSVVQTETITAGAATALAFTTTAQTVAAGACSAVVTVQRQDALGNAVTAGSTTVNLSASPVTGFGFYSDAACSTAASSFTIGAGASTGNFYFKGTSAGSFTVTAASAGLTSANQTETITAGAATALAFTTTAQTVAAGACSAVVTVQRQDALGNAVTAGSNTVNLSASPTTGFAFYSDPGCTTASSSFTIGAGASSGSFYFKGTSAGSFTVTAASAGLTSANQNETITAGTATALVFTTTAQTVAAGACSAVATVRRQDALGNAVTTGSTTVNLSASPTTGFAFYSDAACSTAASSFTIGAGASTGNFYFKGTTAGSFTVTAASAGLTSATQTETITAGAASALAFTTTAQTVAAGACSAVATVQRQDALGNAVTAGSTTVNLSASPTTGFAFYSDPGCTTASSSFTIGAGASSGSFYFKGTSAGSFTVTAASAGLTSANQNETITAGAATALAFTTTAQTVAAGACSAVATVRRQDALGNAVTAGSTTVNLSASPTTGFAFYSDAACSTAASSFTIGAGASTGNFYFKGTSAGSFTVTAASAGLTSATQTETITAGGASQLQFATTAQTVAAGACSAVATVQRQDALGNAVTAGSTTVNLSASPVTGFGFYSDAACSTAASSFTIGAGASTGNFYFKGTSAGSFTVTAASAGLTSATQTETITAGAAAALAFTTTAQTVAAGACSAVATVQRQDALGNAVTAGSTTVNLSASPVTGFAFYSDAGCTTAASSFTIGAGASSGSFYFKGTSAGSFTVTAASAGLTSATQTETIGAGAATALAITTTAQTVAAGACSAVVTVQRQDALGNAVTAGSTTVNLSASPTTGFAFYSDPACSTASSSFTIGAGASTGNFYFKGTSAGSFTVTAASAGLTSATQTETITAGAATALAFTTTVQTVAAGACSAVATVRRQDALGNPVTAGSTTVNLSASPTTGFAFYSDAGCTTAASSFTIGAGASTGNFYFKGTSAGSFTVTAASAGLTSATQTETIGAGAATALVFTTAPVTLTAGACSATALQVQRQDALGNPTTTGAVTVALSASPSSGFAFYTAAGCGTSVTSLPIGAGSSSISFFIKGTTAGSITLTASTAGLTSATQTATINAGTANTLVFVSPAQTVVHGRCSPAVTIQTQDGSGNASAVAASTPLTFSSPTGTMTFYSNPTCATPLSSPAVAAGTNSFLFYFKDTGVGSKTLNAAATGFTGASQVETLTNITPLANAGVDQSQGEGKPVTLTGLASSDGDSDPLTYQWTQTGGPAVSLSSTTASQPSFTTPTVFTATPLTFQLVVNDGVASSAADTVVVTVNNDVNEAPIANAGPDQGSKTGLTFTLDGTGSSDPNGSPITYLWTQIAGPAVTLADPTTATQALVAPFVSVSTPLTFQLVVSDGTAPSTPDTVVVTVAPPDLPAITSVPRKLTAAGVAYQYDPDSTVDATGQAPITFSLLQGPPGFSVSSAGVVAYTPSAAGTFPIRIGASNAAGNTEQDYSLKVVTAPVITSTPRLTASAFAPYRYDADGLPAAVGSPAIGWSLAQAPAGAVVVHDTGEVLWTPLVAGPAQFVLRASNAFGSDDQPFVVQVGAATPPVITATANPRAQVGLPYVYDADEKVGVTPAGTPVSVASGPPGFRVDPLTGQVSWMPLATGVFDVQLVAGAPPLSSAPYAFQVTVVDVPAVPPTAVANATPGSGGGSPLDVLLDGTGSSAASGRALVMFEWDPGDGTPPIPAAQATHTYGAPGGYTPSLAVTDELGQRGVATASVQVGASGALPPVAKLFVDSMKPQPDGSVEVALRCQCSDPQSQPLSYYWELGDGADSSATAPSHAYQSAGTFRVQLTVSNATLSTRASIDVVVQRGSAMPPQARAYASPVRGRAPLLVQLTSSASDPDGYILRRSWSFPDDGSSSDLPSVTHLFASPGVYPVTFQVTDDDGLTSSDRVEVTVLAADGTQPPRFASLGAQQGRVGEAYSYDDDGKPTVTGDAPLSFALESPPAGATIDTQTGAIAWTPQDSGVARLVITATNSAGSATQVVLVQVQPPTTAPVGPCGCGQAGGVPVAGLLMLLGVIASVRNRRRR